MHPFMKHEQLWHSVSAKVSTQFIDVSVMILDYPSVVEVYCNFKKKYKSISKGLLTFQQLNNEIIHHQEMICTI